MNIRIVLLSFAAIVPAASVSAREKYREIVNADTQEKFEQIEANVRNEMQAGGRYEFVKPAERDTVDKNLAAMNALFKQRGSVSEMKQDEKIKLFNAQEVANSILTKRDSDRVICVNSIPVGSHIPVTSCHTFGQEEEARRGAVKKMQDWEHPACVSRKCGASAGG